MLLNIWVLWIGRKCLLIRLLLFGINVRKFLKGDILQNLSMGKFSRGMKGQLRGVLLVKMPARHGLTVSWRSVAMLLGAGITMKDYDEMEDKLDSNKALEIREYYTSKSECNLVEKALRGML